MTSINVVDARLDIYKPGNQSTHPNDADASIPTEDLERVRISERLQNLIDEGEIQIRNRQGQHTDDVVSGARLEFYTQIGSESALSRTWTGMARQVAYDELGATDARIKISLDDFVFGVMDMREVVGAFDQRQISGTATSVVDTLLKRNAPEIDRTQLATFTETTTEVFNGLSLLDAVNRLARAVDGIMWADGTALRFEPLGGLAPAFTLDAAERGIARNIVNDDELINRVRSYGAYDSKLENSLTTFDAYETVTDTTRKTFQVLTRKSNIPRVEIYTDPTQNPGSSDDLVVRVHPNDPNGNTPVDPTDPESDYARRRLSQEFLTQGGFTNFLIPDHTLNDPNPWIIIESTGSNGQAVGVDVNGDPLYKQYFRFPTDLIVLDSPSARKYRRREGARLKQELATRAELRTDVEGILNKTALPDRELAFPADSERTHNLRAGDIITVPSNPRLETSGDHIVTLVDRTYDGSRMRTNVTAQDTLTV